MAAHLCLLLAAALALAPPPPTAASTSPLWGRSGEKWSPEGPLTDFSYAGYRNSDAPIPRPPVTKRLEEFRGRGRSDGSALTAMLDWANRRPQKEGWVVLSLPAGTIKLHEPLAITRPQTVLRGAGSGRTKLAISSPLREAWGRRGGSFSSAGAWLTAGGLFKVQAELARVTSAAPRGAREIRVSSTSRLQKGQTVTVMYDGSRSELAQAIMDDEMRPGRLFDFQEVYFTTQIQKVEGKTVTLRRALPLEIRRAFDVSLVRRESSLHSVGIEGLSLNFEWERYAGHHKERGWNGIEMEKVRDGWVRDVTVRNADNGILVTSCSGVTVEGITVEVTKPRLGPRDAGGDRWDGHWGVRVGLSTDVLVRSFNIESRMHHSVGADSRALLCVFEGGRAPGGNLELHRAQTAQILFTDLELGASRRAFYSGGPGGAGPASGAWTTFWNIRGERDHQLPEQNDGSPGSCSFGAKLNFVGVTFSRSSRLCDDWVYQPGRVEPSNLFAAQLARRQGGGRGDGDDGGKQEEEEQKQEQEQPKEEGGRPEDEEEEGGLEQGGPPAAGGDGGDGAAAPPAPPPEEPELPSEGEPGQRPAPEEEEEEEDQEPADGEEGDDAAAADAGDATPAAAADDDDDESEGWAALANAAAAAEAKAGRPRGRPAAGAAPKPSAPAAGKRPASASKAPPPGKAQAAATRAPAATGKTPAAAARPARKAQALRRLRQPLLPDVADDAAVPDSLSRRRRGA